MLDYPGLRNLVASVEVHTCFSVAHVCRFSQRLKFRKGCSKESPTKRIN
jgi:hypothetical protein